jgi:hypothetical protein
MSVVGIREYALHGGATISIAKLNYDLTINENSLKKKLDSVQKKVPKYVPCVVFINDIK